MISTRLMVGAALMALATAGFAASKPETKREAKPTVKRLTGKQETLACRLGTEDRHARIAVVTIGGKVDSFAYYSKWKPRTCSIYLQRRGDMYSKWADNGNLTTVDVDKGAFIVENRKNEYHFIFRNVDRERYCGMDGIINGTLTIHKGREACELGGDIMVEGTPLGQAWAKGDDEKAPVGLLPVTAQEAAKAPRDTSAPMAGSTEKAAEPQAQPAAPATPAAGTAAPAPTTTATSTAPATTATATSTAPATTAAATSAAPTAPANDAPAATAAAKREPEKAAESSGGARSFFRSFSQSRGPESKAQGE